MTNLTIHDIDEDLEQSLKLRAAHNGRSVEDEVRHLLRQAVDAAPQKPLGTEHGSRTGRKSNESLFDAIRRHIEPLGGVELEIPPRGFGREPPTFD